MANGRILISKPSGGVTTVTSVDSATNTNLVLPESGTVSSVDTSVTDNAIPRFEGTTGKLQNSTAYINDSGEINSPRFISTNSGTDAQLLSFGTEARLISRGTVDLSNKSMAFLTGTTEVFRFDTSGNVLLTSGTGALGYGTGAGGTVTQLTNKATAVTLNKPSGRIVTAADALAAGATVTFTVNNSIFTGADYVGVILPFSGSSYSVEAKGNGNGVFNILLKNITAGSLSAAVNINFEVIKGSLS